MPLTFIRAFSGFGKHPPSELRPWAIKDSMIISWKNRNKCISTFSSSYCNLKHSIEARLDNLK